MAAGGAAGRYVLVYTGAAAQGGMSLGQVQVYTLGAPADSYRLKCPPHPGAGLCCALRLAPVGLPPLASLTNQARPCAPRRAAAETNAAANKPAASAALANASASLQPLVDNNASTCVQLQPADDGTGESAS